MTRVLIVEDHRLVAEGLTLGLRAEGFEVCSTDGAPAALPPLLADFSPDVVLLDLLLGEGRSGVDLIPALRSPGRWVIALTAATDPVLLARALEAGADSVVSKALPFSRLVAEISAITSGRSALVEQHRLDVLRAARLAEQEKERRLAAFEALTRREQEVLALLIRGVPAAEIAETAYVSLSTVRSHIRSILTKLGAHSQLVAISMAAQAGWAPRDPSLLHPPAD